MEICIGVNSFFKTEIIDVAVLIPTSLVKMRTWLSLASKIKVLVFKTRRMRRNAVIFRQKDDESRKNAKKWDFFNDRSQKHLYISEEKIFEA